MGGVLAMSIRGSWIVIGPAIGYLDDIEPTSGWIDHGQAVKLDFVFVFAHCAGTD